MLTKVYWVPAPWRGKLGVAPRPRGGDWLDDELLAWREEGADVVVSLLESREETELGLEGEPLAAQATGLSFISFPIPDRGLPPLNKTGFLASSLIDEMEVGRSILVHCRQGIGRAALIALAVLAMAGEKPESSFEKIAAARGAAVPDTEEQRRWGQNSPKDSAAAVPLDHLVWPFPPRAERSKRSAPP
jgi:protein-tyrosine phosphatase